MRPPRPQTPARGQISSKLKSFADLQLKLIVASMNRIVISRLTKSASEKNQAILEAVEKISITPAQEQSLRRAEEAILQQILVAKKGKVYLRVIASMRTHTPILDTPVTSDVTADQRRRAISLQLLHQFLLTEAVPQAQIIPVRIEDPIDNPFLPTHRVDAFTLTVERWTNTFIYESRPPRAERAQVGTLHAKISRGRMGRMEEKRPAQTEPAPIVTTPAASLESTPKKDSTPSPVEAIDQTSAPEASTPEKEAPAPEKPAATKKEAAQQVNGKVNTPATKKEVSRRKSS